MGNMSGSYGSHYTLWASITQNSQNQVANTSNVTARLYLSFDGSSYWASQYDTTYGEMKINRWSDTEFGQAGATEISELVFSSGVAKDILLASWTGDVPHNSDGQKTFIVKGSWNTNSSRIGSGTCQETKVLTPIARKGVLKINSVNNITMTTAKVNYSHESGLFYHIQYSLNNGAWQNISGNPSITITGLTPNTNYSVRIRALNEDKTIIGDASNSVSFTTVDIGKISSASDFQHGSNASVTITNPSRQ